MATGIASIGHRMVIAKSLLITCLRTAVRVATFVKVCITFPPPFGKSLSGLPITQEFCLEKLTRNNGPFLDTNSICYHLRETTKIWLTVLARKTQQ